MLLPESARRAAFNSSDRLRGVFRRRAQESSAPVELLDDVDRLRVAEWCQMAVDRVQAGPREMSWLTATIMVQMTLGYAVNARSRVPPLAYALITRTGYVLRMLVGNIAPPRPLACCRSIRRPSSSLRPSRGTRRPARSPTLKRMARRSSCRS